MEEQIVSFEVAKLAKEKGFNEETYAFYDSTNTLINPLAAHKESNWTRHIILNKYNDGFVYNSTTGNKVNNYAAPTQSLLQKWLREKYKMDIYIEALLEKQTKNRRYSPVLIYFQGDLRVIVRKNFSKEDDFYLVYEEALEDILEEALKLIDDGDKNKV